MNRILIVEDILMNQLVAKGALGPGFDTQVAASAEEARYWLKTAKFDLILLDIGLPDGDGFSLCSDFLADEVLKKIPIIFLTAKHDIRDKVRGFDLGAEDYITKPFAAAELRARVELRLRRPQEPCPDEIYRNDPLAFDVRNLRAWRELASGRAPLDLSAVEFRLLHHFAANEDRVINRAELLRAAWNDDVHVNERNVDVHVFNLRKTIDETPFMINSIHGVGYAFVRRDGA